MKTKTVLSLFICLLIFGLTNAELEKVYELTMYYEKNTLSLVDINVTEGYAPDRRIQPESGYSCKVFSSEGSNLNSFRFELPITVLYDAINPETGEFSGGMIELNNGTFTLIIPYFKNGKTINIYDLSNNKVLEVDVSKFADVRQENGLVNVLPYIAIVFLVAIVLFIFYKKQKHPEVIPRGDEKKNEKKSNRESELKNKIKDKVNQKTKP